MLAAQKRVLSQVWSLVLSKLFYTTALVMLLCGTAVAQAQQADDDGNAIDDRPHITIIGTASTQVVPDLAEISLGVATEKPSAVDASAENARIAQGIIDAAKAQGVEARDIRTQAVTLTQVFDEPHDANGRFTITIDGDPANGQGPPEPARPPMTSGVGCSAPPTDPVTPNVRGAQNLPR